MINDPQVSDAQSKVAESGGGSRVFTRTTVATALMAVAIAVLGVMSPAQLNKEATAQSANAMQAALPDLPVSVALDSGQVGPFAFGYLVFENDPANGVPGFGPLPPRSSAR